MKRPRQAVLYCAAAAGVLGAAVAMTSIGKAKAKAALPASAPPAPLSEAPAGRVAFADTTATAGVSFTQYTGGCGEAYFVEQVASGVAVFDANGDGNLDLYFPQPKFIGICKAPEPVFQRLYLGDGKGGFKLAARAFDRESGYGIGGNPGDYDNDGDLDLFVTCWGRNVLYENDGRGRFKDVTPRAGVGNTGFGTSSVWFDYDRDGYLDLYIANYSHYLLADNIICPGPDGTRDVCAPTVYPPMANVLYHNNRDGTFSEVTTKANALVPDRRTLGLAAADFDDDGWTDLFVSNDLSANSLLLNTHKGRFEDVAVQKGVAFGPEGKTQANMGVAIGDYDRNGWFDAVVTVFSNEPYTLYANQGSYFLDQSEASNLARITRAPLGFGTFFFDADNDGWEDLFFANGHVSRWINRKHSNMTYEQQNQLVLNDGKGRFLEATSSLPQVKRVHRGAAYGDFDRDGDLDIVVTSNDGPPAILRNDSPAANWIRVRLVNAAGCSSPIGARCTLTSAGGKQYRVLAGGASYASQSEYVCHFGIGRDTTAQELKVRWLSGKEQTLRDVPARSTVVIREGKEPVVKSGA